MERLTLDPTESRLRVWTYKDGLLSRVAHDLCLQATELTADLSTDGERFALRVVVPVRRLKVQGQVKKDGRVVPLKLSDHEEIERSLSSAAVLDAVGFPEVTYAAEGEWSGQGSLTVSGELTLKGRTRPLPLSARVVRDGEELRIDGEVRLAQTAFGITPFKAMLGALKVQDEVKVSWALRYTSPGSSDTLPA